MRIVTSLMMVLLGLASTACDFGFLGTATPFAPRALAEQIPIGDSVDVLIVVDNSGSMAEEHEKLAQALCSSSEFAGANPCDSAGLAALREQWSTLPDGDPDFLPADQATKYQACGVIERLLLRGEDFHIGVISTAMNDCDQPGPSVGRGSIPQRGCLTSDGSQAPVTVLTSSTPDVANTLAKIVLRSGVNGSPYEQGLASAKHFLTPGHDSPSPGTCTESRDCSQDLANFLHADQETTPLSIIFVTDEDDCSHEGAIDETVPGNTGLCYSNPELLRPVQAYADYFNSLKPRRDLLSVTVLAGINTDLQSPDAAGCVERLGEVSLQCDPSQGNSVATCSMCVNGEPICSCHPEIQAEDCQGTYQAPTNCCEADPATRYVSLSHEFVQQRLGSLCQPSYQQKMHETVEMILANEIFCPQQKLDGVDFRLQAKHVDGTVQELSSQDWSFIEANTCLRLTHQVRLKAGDVLEILP